MTSFRVSCPCPCGVSFLINPETMRRVQVSDHLTRWPYPTSGEQPCGDPACFCGRGTLDPEPAA